MTATTKLDAWARKRDGRGWLMQRIGVKWACKTFGPDNAHGIGVGRTAEQARKNALRGLAPSVQSPPDPIAPRIPSGRHARAAVTTTNTGRDRNSAVRASTQLPTGPTRTRRNQNRRR